MASSKDLPIRFDEYKYGLELAEREADRFWARNNVLLLVQGALIAFYDTANGSGAIYGLLATAQGFFLSLLWVGILVKGKNYISRWDHATREMERRLLKDFPGKVQGLIKLNDKGREQDVIYPLNFLNKSTTILITYFVYMLLIFWGVLFLIAASPMVEPFWKTIVLPLLQK